MARSLKRVLSQVVSGVRKEIDVLRTLHHEVQAALVRMNDVDPGLKALLDRAYAYAVFPEVGKAGAVVGAAFGKGEVFKGKHVVGYAAIAQLTIGVQLGGQTFAEVIVFESEPALERFKRGKFAFAANASAVLLKAGAAAHGRYEKGVAVLVHSEGGLEIEAAIGGQKFFFRPAVLGRLKHAPELRKGASSGDGVKSKRSSRHGRSMRERSRNGAGRAASSRL